MKLFEYEAKEIFRNYGLNVPNGEVVSNPKKAFGVAKRLNKEVVLKPQVLVGGRGKAGAIKFAKSAKDAERYCKEIMNMKVKGEEVKQVLIEEKIDVKDELYVGVVVDRSFGKPVVVVSSEGGVDIEETAKDHPEKIFSKYIDIRFGLRQYEARALAKKIGLSGSDIVKVGTIIWKLYAIFRELDAEIVEVNPLVKGRQGEFFTVGAVITINEDSLYRQKEILKLNKRDYLRKGEEIERIARSEGFSYVELNGNIGIIGNGAGLVMSTLDLINFTGGKPANFLDIGGGAPPERMKRAIEIALMNPKLKVLFVNVFGGINRCDEIAEGIVLALKGKKLKVPLVVRLIGTNEDKGKEILTKFGINALTSMEEAVKEAVKLATR